MIEPSTVPAPLPAPLTKQEIKNIRANSYKLWLQGNLLTLTLIIGICVNVFLLVTYSPYLHDLFLLHTFTWGIFFYSFFAFVSYLFINCEPDITNYQAINKDYTPVDTKDYSRLLELKNNHRAIANYINTVAAEGRELIKMELHLLNGYGVKFYSDQEHTINELAKMALYSSESKV